RSVVRPRSPLGADERHGERTAPHRRTGVRGARVRTGRGARGVAARPSRAARARGDQRPRRDRAAAFPRVGREQLESRVTWRLSVEHQTEHVYGGTVLASYNEVRITPRATSGQVVLDHDVGIRPASRVLRYVDYWGTKVTAFDVHQPHDRLVVNGR